jgi:hypothetical protein
MSTPAFIDLEDTEDPDSLPPPPVTEDVTLVGPKKDTVVQERYGHLLPHGTTVSTEWDESWIRKVIEAEKLQGHAICGAKRSTKDMSLEEIESADPVTLVCKRRAGWDTPHTGEGRCRTHGGMVSITNTKHGGYSLLKHNKLGPRVQEFFENEKMMDITTAIATTYAAADAMLEGEEEITPRVANDIAAMMTRVANMVKQHNDIQEKRRISIEVPEFMAWAEYFYELAVKHIMQAGGDPAPFLRDAQTFYDRTVTIVVGPQAGRNRLGTGGEVSDLSDEGVPRP